MKERYRTQARKLYESLYAKGLTWTRQDSVIDEEWAEQFMHLADKIKSQKRIQRLLNWFCEKGAGAVYVPIVGGADAFVSKFEQLDAARKRLNGQRLRYFDDVIEYSLSPRTSGSQAQKEYAICKQKFEQQIELVDALVHGRTVLPAVKPKFKKSAKVTYSPFLAEARKKMTKVQRARLDSLLNVDREVLWQLMMQVPSNQQALIDRLESSGWFTKCKDHFDSNDDDSDEEDMSTKQYAMNGHSRN